MSPDDVRTFFEDLVDDAPDVTTSAVLMDVAYTKRNDARFWTFLLKLDSSMTHGSGDSWTTNHTLPSDFEEPYKVYAGAGGQNEYGPIPYEQILNFIGAANRYSIDYANSMLRT